ncbi:N-acetylmuramoyl-L-alanine amidase [Brevibacillus formosus]|uniref:N-acetylmuramoyl-L-alanine amidase n=1 Tax=Brevibacillus TaxID=55080 RepID=UPI000D0ECDBF|nr:MULTISPECIES: N-acetylmuramoyl-L-alanine amidase [Brevibacillus]MBG9942857.1 N-acetylmuramoyl-L-alanine amidase [Brevibacillus formosus]MED1945688.1 N-acetylmuramoyl-L-alanine amidase [Brevibacillus formosus]MED2000679.1 N-acetylmuramoyl-L-alanine amidase [Brevibacillus formosus]MED2084475.1 N-acetylmuramoyl-L-alanine amidase [Brevibacillus formosus]PSK15651.1 N-acetylmuramoyl-L-alanine amidase [Brevibacillus sp. NRRL NRS-603]
MNMTIPGARVIDVRTSLPRHKTLRYGRRKLTDIRSAAIHHSATLSGSPEAFARYHVSTNGWPGIAYHFVIQKDGVIYWCNDPETISYHVGNSNRHALGICLVGDFRTQQPTAAQLEAANHIIQHLQVQIPTMKQVLGHQEYPGYAWKNCPAFPMGTFRTNYSQFLQKSVVKVDKPKQVPVAIKLNEVLLPVAGFLQEGLSMLPVRAVANAAGGKVEWIEQTKDVRVNGKDLNEKVISGSAYAPARELATALGLQIEWDQATKTVRMMKGSVSK